MRTNSPLGKGLACLLGTALLLTLVSTLPTLYVLEQSQHIQQMMMQQAGLHEITNSHHIMTNNTSGSMDNVPSSSSSVSSAWMDQLLLGPAEIQFRSTLKSCLPLSLNEHPQPSSKKHPKDKCGQYMKPTHGRSEQRIAFTAAPGKVAQTVWELIDALTNHYNNLHKDNATVPILHAFWTTHVPPYGYGKTHGLTKIIRLEPHPLLLQVADVVAAQEEQADHSLLSSTNTDASSSYDSSLWNMTLRQIARFHCRMSHVSAHTALLTLNVTTPQERIVQQLTSFLFPTTTTTTLEDPSIMTAASITSSWKERFPEIVKQQYAQATRVLRQHPNNNKHSSMPVVVLDQLADVLAQELTLSKNMTIWPCPSFWLSTTTSNNNIHNPTALSHASAKLARALSPDCADASASCWVARDKCEAAGDALCQQGTKRGK